MQVFTHDHRRHPDTRPVAGRYATGSSSADARRRDNFSRQARTRAATTRQRPWNTTITNNGTIAITSGAQQHVPHHRLLRHEFDGRRHGDAEPSGATPIFLRGGGGVTLTNTDNTIQGAGNIADSGVLNAHQQFDDRRERDRQDAAPHRRRRRHDHQQLGFVRGDNGGTFNLYFAIANPAQAPSPPAAAPVQVFSTITGGTLTTLPVGPCKKRVVRDARWRDDLVGQHLRGRQQHFHTTQWNNTITNNGTIAITSGANFTLLSTSAPRYEPDRWRHAGDEQPAAPPPSCCAAAAASPSPTPTTRSRAPATSPTAAF